MRIFIFRPRKLKCACEKVKCACDKRYIYACVRVWIQLYTHNPIASFSCSPLPQVLSFYSFLFFLFFLFLSSLLFLFFSLHADFWCGDRRHAAPLPGACVCVCVCGVCVGCVCVFCFCFCFCLHLWNFIISASHGIFLDKAQTNSRII